jgi:hypothetical protein
MSGRLVPPDRHWESVDWVRNYKDYGLRTEEEINV